MINTQRVAQPQDQDALVAQLVAAGISADRILDPDETDPRMRGLRDGRIASWLSPGTQSRHDDHPPSAGTPRQELSAPAERAAAPRLAAVPQEYSTPPQPGAGVRLLPLAGFHWGKARLASAPQSPRVRGDHVLLCPRKGALSINFPRGSHMLAAGRLAFIPAGTAFSICPPDDIDGQVLLIPPGACRLPALPATFCSGAPAEADAELIQPAIRALAANAVASRTDPATLCHLELLAVALSRLESRPEQPATGIIPLAEARMLTESFLAAIRHEPGQGRTIAEMAGLLGCSLARLDRACRQARGRSALELLYDLRLELATTALRDAGKPMSEIARECGYAGLSHFMRAFQAATGRSPDAYRQWLNPGVGATDQG